MVTVFDTSDFPQADRLGQVADVVLAVADGRTTDFEIEEAIGLDSGARQGRYYRSAAVQLGLIYNDGNYASLTQNGQIYSRLSESHREEYLRYRIVETPLFGAALQFIAAANPTDAEFRQWVRDQYEGALATANRRYVTVRAWLQDAGLIALNGGRYELRTLLGAVAVNVTGMNFDETPEDTEAASTLSYEVSTQKRDRANLIHKRLVNAVSADLSRRHMKPLQNALIDLYARDGSAVIMFEMKSVSGENYHSQIRKAVSQLHEYRYVHRFDTARLCIATNLLDGQPPSWILDYLNDDRIMGLIEVTDDNTLHSRGSTSNLIGFN